MAIDPSTLAPYKLLVVDDEDDVHAVTRMVLRGFEFDQRRLDLLDAYSAGEAQDLLREHPDVALILLDVVMEKRDSGLQLARWIREDLKNSRVRIILRTGQPGDAPENSVIRDFDINDYKLKTDLTQQKLFTTLFSSLRSYRDIVTIERSRENLQRIVEIGSQLFSSRSLDEFLLSMIDQIARLYDDAVSSAVVRVIPRPVAPVKSGVIVRGLSGQGEIIAATGSYRGFVGATLDQSPLGSWLEHEIQALTRSGHDTIRVLDRGLLISSRLSHDAVQNVIYLEEPLEGANLDQIRLFLTNFSLTLDNFSLNQFVHGLQNDMLFLFGEVIERQSKESSRHVKRVSLTVAALSRALGDAPDVTETLRLASILHDIGKIGVSDSILKKAGPLDAGERLEMQRHAQIGHDILARSELPLFRSAALIALRHHEQWDGGGYPGGLKGEQIPVGARITALADVFDALVNARAYKDAWPPQDVLQELQRLSGRHFDPAVLRAFLDNVDEMLAIQKDNEG